MNHVDVINRAESYANSRAKSDVGLRVGAIAVGDHSASFGTNHLVSESYAIPEILNDRERRLRVVVHAEADAINNSFYQIDALYCNYHPCLECAEKIVAAKVKYVYYAANVIPRVSELWKDKWDAARRLMQDNGVTVVEIRRPIDRWEDEHGAWADDGGACK